jgi:CheY-like chemotaxis protein
MSLVGNLEDLGLGDILQIVSLSRKSGVLALNSRGREGKVIFLNGQVIRATSSQFPENFGELLLRRGLISVEILKKAVFVQRNSERPPRLGTILADKFGVSREKIEAAVQEQIEKIVYSFFAWNEGGFSFEVGEPEDLAAVRFLPLQFILDQGLNPQWLAMEGSRILDEMRHRGESFEEQDPGPSLDLEKLLGEQSPVEPPARAMAVNADCEAGAAEPLPLEVEAGRPLILLVDNDQATRGQLSNLLRDRGLAVSTFLSGREFLQAAAQAVAVGVRPLLLVDMIMPHLDDSGILGGLELLEQVRRRFPDLTVLMITDRPLGEAAERAKGLGAAEILTKPGGDALAGGSGWRLLERLGDTVAEFAGIAPASIAAGSGNHVNLGAELSRELGGESFAAHKGLGQETPGLHLLRGMLQELHNPALGGGILLLVLRFASEVMNRAVVFAVKDDNIVGLGQFGIESCDGSAEARIRQICIPVQDESIFRQAITEMVPLRMRPANGRWDHYFRDQLGGGCPEEVFLGPILSEGKVVAVLYGDNYPAPGPVGDTESLEIFLSQAGQAMEKALLERRLRSRDEQE